MKFIVAIILVAASFVSADVLINPNRIQLSHGSDCVGVQVSSGTAALVINAPNGYSYANIQDEDGTDNVFCAFRSNVAISGALRGKKIKAGDERLFILAPTVDSIYCITDHSAGAINAMLCRGN